MHNSDACFTKKFSVSFVDRSPEIDAGLSLSEADVGSHLTDLEQEESTEVQTDWILANSYFSGNDTEIPPK